METDGYDPWDDPEESKAYNEWLEQEWHEFADQDVPQDVVDEEDRLELRRRLTEAQGES